MANSRVSAELLFKEEFEFDGTSEPGAADSIGEQQRSSDADDKYLSPDMLEDSVGLYLSQSLATPLLTSKEEYTLGMCLEEGQRLKKIEKECQESQSGKAHALNILAALIEHVCTEYVVFNALCCRLKLNQGEDIQHKVQSHIFRNAVDGQLDRAFIDSIARSIGRERDDVHASIVALSVDTRIIPWHLLTAVKCKSLEELESSTHKLEVNEYAPEIEKHFEKIRQKEQQALEHMLKANLRLVVSIAKNYKPQGMSFLDVIQEGNLGILRAIKRFDYRRGYKFSTYATWWIRQAITRALIEKSRIMRLPVHKVDEIKRVISARHVLSHELGRKPTAEEIGSKLDVPISKVNRLMRTASEQPISLDMPIGDGDDSNELGDFIEDRTAPAPEELAMKETLRKEISDTLNSLEPRERYVIELRFGLKNEEQLTLEEIGENLGVTRERVRQIELKALNKLRTPELSKRLKDYVE